MRAACTSRTRESSASVLEDSSAVAGVLALRRDTTGRSESLDGEWWRRRRWLLLRLASSRPCECDLEDRSFWLLLRLLCLLRLLAWLRRLRLLTKLRRSGDTSDADLPDDENPDASESPSSERRAWAPRWVWWRWRGDTFGSDLPCFAARREASREDDGFCAVDPCLRARGEVPCAGGAGSFGGGGWRRRLLFGGVAFFAADDTSAPEAAPVSSPDRRAVSVAWIWAAMSSSTSLSTPCGRDFSLGGSGGGVGGVGTTSAG